jgi:hypothetical protein
MHFIKKPIYIRFPQNILKNPYICFGFLEAILRGCRGFLKCFEETLYIGFLNKVHLVGDRTLISEKCTVNLE